MSDDLTRKMPSNDDRDGDLARIERRLDTIIGMVETLNADLQNVKSDLQNVKSDLQNVKSDLQNVKSDLQNVSARLDKLERTVEERLYDTRPIWERALAEIGELRMGLDEVRSGIAEIGELRTEVAEVRAGLTGLREEVQEGFYNLRTRIELLLRDMFTLRTDHERLSRRVDDLRGEAS